MRTCLASSPALAGGSLISFPSVATSLLPGRFVLSSKGFCRFAPLRSIGVHYSRSAVLVSAHQGDPFGLHRFAPWLCLHCGRLTSFRSHSLSASLHFASLHCVAASVRLVYAGLRPQVRHCPFGQPGSRHCSALLRINGSESALPVQASLGASSGQQGQS